MARIRTRDEIRILPRDLEEGMYVRLVRDGDFARESDGMTWFTVASVEFKGDDIRVVTSESIVRPLSADSVVYLVSLDGVAASALVAAGDFS